MNQCRDCGSTDVNWTISAYNTSNVVDGRLKLNEIATIAVLGCESCSATLMVMDANKFLQKVLSKQIPFC